MRPVQISEGKTTTTHRRRRTVMSCCCCFGPSKTDSAQSVSSRINEPYEYVVEKLIIKRVPIKSFVGEEGDDGGKPTNDLISVKEREDETEVKPIVTFSSYCQMTPTKAARGDGAKSAGVEGAKDDDGKSMSIETANKEDMTTGRRQQLEQCANKYWTSAQVYKPITPPTKRTSIYSSTIGAADNGKVLFTKVMSNTPGPAEEVVDPAVQETIQMLATKKSPVLSRRIVQRDPKTGQFMDKFQRKKYEKPVKLDEIYQDLEEPIEEDGCGDGAAVKSPDSSAGIKWRIIIKHRDDKKKCKAISSSEGASEAE